MRNNPVNYTDPLGLCVNCYIFYFTGAGSLGDIDGNGEINEMLGGESDLIKELGLRTGAVVTSLYPYGKDIGPNTINDPLWGQDSNRNLRDVIFPAAYQRSPIPRYKALEIVDRLLGNACHEEEYGKGKFNDANINVMFIGYSGGGQMAYSTAQSLRGYFQVDNVVMFGSPFRAHSGVGNIGHLWSFVSSKDKLYQIGQAASLIADELYRPGHIPASWETQNLPMYLFQNATFCYTTGKTPDYGRDPFANHMNDYFDKNSEFTGYSCMGKSSKQVEAQYSSKSMFQAHLDTLVGIIEGRIK